MSVRPVTQGEFQRALGLPFMCSFATLGGLQGLLVYLHRTRIPINQNWFASPGSFKMFNLCILGGTIGGALIAHFAFKDKELMRLDARHEQDKIKMVDGQTFENFQQ